MSGALADFYHLSMPLIALGTLLVAVMAMRRSRKDD